MLYKFSPVFINPLSNAVLCVHLQKCLSLVTYNTKAAPHGHETRIALYSIDCVRKLLLNHCLNSEALFERLDEAREAEMKDDEDFWQPPASLNHLSLQGQESAGTKKPNEETSRSQTTPLELPKYV